MIEKWTLSFLLLLPITSLAQIPSPDSPPTDSQYGLGVEYFRYEDRLYSQSRKTAIGEQVELDTAFRYRFSENTYSRFRFEIDPQEDSLEGKATKLEFLLNHSSGPFVGQLDLDLKGSDGESGGLSIGPDSDSEGTFLSYRGSESFRFNFFPYNFDGEVGDEFNTWDVTRIYYITGSPTGFDPTAQPDENRIVARTIPGLGIDYFFAEHFRFSAAFGVATYYYPSNPDYDIEDNRTSNQWERREDTGWRASLSYSSDSLMGVLEHVTHDKAHETGSLLSSATALRLVGRFAPLILEAEVVRSTAGKNAYELNDRGDWFRSDRNEPVYSDLSGNRQNWLGESDYAAMLKVGFKNQMTSPYLSYKWQGENFIYRDLESAHLLRTNDELRSHGGLQRIGVGAHIFTGGLEIQPELEWMMAKNDVFGNSTDIRSDRLYSDLNTTDLLLSIVVKYAFDQTGEARY